MVKVRVPILVLIFLLVLPGCFKVGPDFHRPQAQVSKAWVEASDQRVKTGPADYRGWWHVFKDPVLDRLIDRAYRENLSLKIAGIRVLEARTQLAIAVGRFYPQTQQAIGSLQYNRTSERAPQAVFNKNLNYWESEIGLNVIWELDFWGKFRRSIESGTAVWLGSIADYDNALVTLTGDAANSYIKIRTLEKRIAIAQQNVETQRESLKIAEARFRYGTTSELDLEQAKTVLNNTLASLPPLDTELRQAKHSLNILLGLPPSDLTDFLEGGSEIPVSPPQVVVGIPADLLRRRPDIRSAELQAAAQSAQIGVAKADLYPAFSLSGTFVFLSSDVGKFRLTDMFQWGSRNVEAGPSFQWNILNYGRITNNVRFQDARLQELLLTYQNTVLTAQQEVEDNLIAFLRAQERAGFLAQSVTAAKNALDLAVRQYREGLKDFTTVLTSQQNLLAGQDDLAITFGDISTSLVKLYKALGGGWEIRQGEDLLPPEIKEEMAKRTHWGRLLALESYNAPSFEEPEPSVRLPEW